MKNRILNSILFKKEKAESLKNIRIIKTNLVHVHGFPKSFAESSILKSPEYFGQYGTIVKTIISSKMNPDTKTKKYSAYITYSNEREAALAILCVDSLMIQGKIIRAFFGTTKYCKYFLENNRCPNLEKCLFLHKLVDDKDIVIDSNIVFSYNEHINLAKKISKLSNPETINFLRKMVKPKKNVFPSVDFVLLNEDEKENYFAQGGISYVKSVRKIEDNLLLNNINKNNLEQKSSNICHDIVNNNIINNNNSINNLNKNDSIENQKFINNINEPKSLKIPFYFENKIDIYKSEDPSDLHKIFSNSVNHILIVKPFLNNINKQLLKKMEFEYFKEDLNKQGININYLLNGCLDGIKEILFEK
jgi:hypothetical protein